MPMGRTMLSSVIDNRCDDPLLANRLKFFIPKTHVTSLSFFVDHDLSPKMKCIR